MLMSVCRDHGNIRLTTAQIRDQKDSDDRWRCSKCNLLAECIDIPEVAVGTKCLACKEATTIKSLWDEKHRHFFCNVLCVGDYDNLIKEQMKSNVDKQRGATGRNREIYKKK